MASIIATILSLNGGLLTTILCIHNQYLVTINSQIKLSVCLSVCLSAAHLFCHCPELNIQRERFWNKLIQSYDVSLESYLVHLSDFNFVNTLLGATIPYFENNAKEHLKVMKHYFMFVYMVYSLKMVSTKDHRGL